MLDTECCMISTCDCVSVAFSSRGERFGTMAPVPMCLSSGLFCFDVMVAVVMHDVMLA